MYTATITNKVETPQGLEVTVEFSNGTNTQSEKVIPQDKAGFKHWVSARLNSLNTLDELKAEDNIGQEVVIDDPVVDTRTQAEKDRDAWLAKYWKWVNIKKNLIDTGILTGQETAVTNYLADVKAGFKADYINYI